MIYIVDVKEVHVEHVRIEAPTPEEAIMRVKDGAGQYLEPMSYPHS